MTSILTNNGAIVALKTLRNINMDLNKTQEQISTGKRINNAAQGSAVWAVSQIMKSDEASFRTINDGLTVAGSVVASAVEGAAKIKEYLDGIKTRLAASHNEDQDRAKNWEEVKELFGQIKSEIDSRQVNGVNLLKEKKTGDETYDKPTTTYKVLSSLDRSVGEAQTSAVTIDVSNANLVADVYDKLKDLFVAQAAVPAGTDADGNATAEIPAKTGAAPENSDGIQTIIGTIDEAIDNTVKAGAALGAKQARIEAQAATVRSLADSLKTSVGALVDTNLEEASARLQALQTQQQLGIQSLSIANQAPGAVLSLFR